MATGNATRYITAPICVVAVVACGSVAQRTSSASGPSAAVAADGAPADAGAAGARPLDAAPTAIAESFGDGPGQSPARAIEVCRPLGQLAYLHRLRCGDQRAPTFAREGQRGYRNPRRGDADYQRSADQVKTWRPLAEGETDLHPIDVYSIRCGGGPERELYMDMYHCDEGAQTAEAPPGLTLAPAPPPVPEK